MAKKGWKQAVIEDKALAKGINIMNGKITNAAVAKAHNLPYSPAETVLTQF